MFLLHASAGAPVWFSVWKKQGKRTKTVNVMVHGDSMQPEIFDGEIVRVVLTDQIQIGALVLVETPHGLLLKRLELAAQPGHVVLASVNPAFRNHLWPAEDIRVLGIVQKD